MKEDKKKKRNIASMTAMSAASPMTATAKKAGGKLGASAKVPTMGKARYASELPTAMSVPLTQEYKDGRAGKIMKEDPEISDNNKKIKEMNKKMKKMKLEKDLKKNKK